ncbi:MAG: four helix bundle protein [Bacteroidales bacterium]|nr:four helix bundle protein [Lentimicrobiaceae bacterium]MDD5696043.1 four helix bundle protein [Bacteroidales bacterium]
MTPKSTSYQIENRLINFVVRIQDVLRTFPNTYFHSQLANQLSRSSTSTALNYAEAQSAESSRDFIHKIKIVLKELRECHVSLRILVHNKDLDNTDEILALVTENNELIAIFVKSIQTAEKNLQAKENNLH